MSTIDTGHHRTPATVTMHHPGIDATIVVRARLEDHYTARGWQRIDEEPAAAAGDDVQVVEPCDFEPAFIYGPDDPREQGDQPPVDDPGDGVEKTGIDAPADGTETTLPAPPAPPDDQGTQPAIPDAQEG